MPTTLSSLSRGLTVAAAICFGVLGGALFVAADATAPSFAWRVSPMVVMTVGGWSLGTAAMAAFSAYVWRWAHVYAMMLYLWAFGAFELLVLVAFQDKLVTGPVVAKMYLVCLVVIGACALTGVVDLIRLRPAWSTDGAPCPRPLRVGIAGFVVGVVVLSIGGAVVRVGGLSSEAGVFPERLSLFTIRAFAAFFAALAVGAIPLLWTRTIEPVLWYCRAGLALVVPILGAALWHHAAFDLSLHPGQLAYVGAYVVVGVLSAITLVLRRGLGAVADPTRQDLPHR